MRLQKEGEFYFHRRAKSCKVTSCEICTVIHQSLAFVVVSILYRLAAKDPLVSLFGEISRDRYGFATGYAQLSALLSPNSRPIQITCISTLRMIHLFNSCKSTSIVVMVG
jgi:hypothetical protein